MKINKEPIPFSLRYYAPHYRPPIHDTLLGLLERIRLTHGTPSEVIALKAKKSEYSADLFADPEQQKEVYRRDFLPRSKVLKTRIGDSVRRFVRSRRGGHFVAGTVAIVSEAGIEWFAHYDQPFAALDPDPNVAFLKAVLDKGPVLLSELCTAVPKDGPEQQVIDTFIKSGVLKGTIRQEVKIGRNRFEAEGADFDWRKSIDLVIENDEEIWILEAKTRLNYEAIGEVVTYSILYEDERSEKRIRKGIVCGALDRELLYACNRLGITVFGMSAEGIRVYEPEGTHC